MIKAGTNYTVVIGEDNSIRIFGSETILELESDAFKSPIVEVNCSKFEECFAVLSDE